MIKNMTEGSPLKILLSFSMPMLFSMMFQQFYNIVDSVVAGKFIGVDALAAIGASYPITVLFIAVANGASVGAAVVVSQTFGANKLVKMKTSVSTSVIAITIVSIVLTIFGTLFCSDIMRMINTPENIFSDSRLYLKVYIWGLIFLFMYNTATAIFTGLGENTTLFPNLFITIKCGFRYLVCNKVSNGNIRNSMGNIFSSRIIIDFSNNIFIL
jgi:Na+-driven multidrug efflux pump